MRLSFYGVVTTMVAIRVAAQYSGGGFNRPANCAVFIECIDGILGTGRGISATRRKDDRNCMSIKLDESDQETNYDTS